MRETTFIYALLDPRTMAVRYIGKSDDPNRRLYDHITHTRESNRKANWIKSLAKNGIQPVVEIIDEVQRSEWQAAEAAYIIFFKEEGCVLVNGTPGGEGSGSGKDNPQFGKPPSAETRAKMSAARKGKPLSPQTKAKLSKALTGRKLSNEQRAMIIAFQRNRKPASA